MVECRDRVFLKRRAACAPAATAGVKRRRRGASLLRHPGLAQTGEVRSDHHRDLGDAELPGGEYPRVAWVRAFLAYGIS